MIIVIPRYFWKVPLSKSLVKNDVSGKTRRVQSNTIEEDESPQL